MKKLSHVNEQGNAIMVDVTAKKDTRREAIAAASVRMKPGTLRSILDKEIPKGDVFSAARIAGIMAAKQTPSLIPLCHPLLITSVEVDFETDEGNNRIGIYGKVTVTGKTGVEMEALTAVSVAALTIYDMCKALDKEITITDIMLIEKKGGTSGTYQRK